MLQDLKTKHPEMNLVIPKQGAQLRHKDVSLAIELTFHALQGEAPKGTGFAYLIGGLVIPQFSQLSGKGHPMAAKTSNKSSKSSMSGLGMVGGAAAGAAAGAMVGPLGAAVGALAGGAAGANAKTIAKHMPKAVTTTTTGMMKQAKGMVGLGSKTSPKQKSASMKSAGSKASAKKATAKKTSRKK